MLQFDQRHRQVALKKVARHVLITVDLSEHSIDYGQRCFEPDSSSSRRQIHDDDIGLGLVPSQRLGEIEPEGWADACT